MYIYKNIFRYVYIFICLSIYSFLFFDSHSFDGVPFLFLTAVMSAASRYALPVPVVRKQQ